MRLRGTLKSLRFSEGEWRGWDEARLDFLCLDFNSCEDRKDDLSRERVFALDYEWEPVLCNFLQCSVTNSLGSRSWIAFKCIRAHSSHNLE